MGDVSKNFSLHEFTVSQTASRMGRAIIPTKKERQYLIQLIHQVMQPIRDMLEQPVVVTSGLRPEWLNAQIGGAERSQHCLGQAADFIVPGADAIKVCRAIEASDIEFDRLICEFGHWTHVSFMPGPSIRHEILTARSSDGTTIYTTGLGTIA